MDDWMATHQPSLSRLFSIPWDTGQFLPGYFYPRLAALITLSFTGS
jgi:hypothetical protein